MKKISPFLLFLILIVVMSLTSCGAGKLNDKAEAMSNSFYVQLQHKNYDSALTLCSSKAFEGITKEDWINKLERNAGLLGNIVSFKKTSAMNISVSTATGTTVAVTYDVQWQFGQSQDSVWFVKEKGNDMKIIRYSWKHLNTKYVAGMLESEKQANIFLNAIQQGDYTGALDLCREEAFATMSREKWVAFYENSAKQYGNVGYFHVVSDSSTYAIEATGPAGKGNYYEVVFDVSLPAGNVKEKLVFYQKDYNEAIKLTGHYFL